MRETKSWIRKLWPFAGRRSDVLTLITPDAVRERSPLVRLAVAGGTVGAIFAAGIVGMTAFAVLLLAIGVIYFLATQVLGLRVNVDPQALYQQVQRQAAQYGVN